MHTLGDLAQRPAVDRPRVLVDETGPHELARDERDAAGLEEVGGDVPAARLDVGDDRRARGDRVEVVDLERDPGLGRDREQMQHAVGRAAGRCDRGDRVLERLAGQDLRRARVLHDESHRELAGQHGRLRLRRMVRRDLVQARRAHAEEVERRRHRVGGEVPAARAGARAGDTLERVHLPVGDLAGSVRTDRLEDVLDRHVGAAIAARLDRAAVEDEPGQVEPRERHHAGRDRLVAADDADEAVEQVAAGDELDRVGDHLARDERRAHADRAHRDAVGDRDRVELDRRPACARMPCLT